MIGFDNLTISEVKSKLINKEVSPKEITNFFIQKIIDNKKLNCFITETFEKAIEMANESEKKIMAGKDIGLLEGIPIAMKDLFCTAGVKTTAGSKILENFIPYYESTVSKNLWNSGAIMLGKSNLDEFAMGSANTTSYYGNVINPWKSIEKLDQDLVPGGSSGGSASAVAADLCLAATGSDTGGSIRQPAAFCGLVGFKPTYGRCSRFGMIAFASSLDQAGPITKDVMDSSIVLKVMCSFDKKDSTSLNVSNESFSDNLDTPFESGNVTRPLAGLSLGVPEEYFSEALDNDVAVSVKNGIKSLESMGAKIKTISLPTTKFAVAAYYYLEVFVNESSIFSEDLLISLPNNLIANLPSPDFSIVSSAGFISTVISITLIASIESLLSIKAVDKLDPKKKIASS